MANIPNITRKLLIANVIMMLLSYLIPDIKASLALHYFQASNFHFYQFITYMFMHADYMHLFFNMFALWMFGAVMERTWGSQRFLIYYLVCGIGAGVIQELSQFTSLFINLSSQGCTLGQIIRIDSIMPGASEELNLWRTVGASGSIYGILLAFGMSYPEERMFVFPIPVPIKAKWLITGYIVLELVLALSNKGDGVAHVAHLGGMLFGYLLIRYWRKSYVRQQNFGGWDSYEDVTDEGSSFSGKATNILGRIRKIFERNTTGGNSRNSHSGTSGGTRSNASYESTSSHQADWNYNQQKQATEEEIDAILDKIRRSGYAALSAEEKRKLFEASKK